LHKPQILDKEGCVQQGQTIDKQYITTPSEVDQIFIVLF
jgi:hypothetical protein